MLFGKNDDNVLSFAFGGYKFKADGDYITYQSAYGKSFRVRKSDIDTVSLDEAGAGKNKLTLVGHGSTLAQVELPKPWTESAQDFILNKLDKK